MLTLPRNSAAHLVVVETLQEPEGVASTDEDGLGRLDSLNRVRGDVNALKKNTTAFVGSRPLVA